MPADGEPVSGAGGPSKRELIAAAEDLAQELGLDVVTSGLTKSALRDLVDDLRARCRARAEDLSATAPPVPREPDAAWTPVVEPELGAYCVAPGRSITSRRGILGPGTQVLPRDVSGGEERLAHLERAGVLQRRRAEH